MLFAFLSHDLPLVTYQLVCGYFRTEGMFEQYLIQPETQNEIPPSLLAKAAKQLLIGHLVLQWIPLYFFYDVFGSLGVPSIFSPVPWRQLILFIPFMVLCDTLLYWSHRTLHHPLLYTRFHKQHHEFKSNVPFASEYFTLTEEIFTGFIPTLAVR
jgi:methylsterol monooxygenase